MTDEKTMLTNEEIEEFLRQYLVPTPIVVPIPATAQPDDERDDDYVILASSEEEAQAMRERAEESGATVRGVTVWTGPVPEEGSFEYISPTTRMSTPEYFFLRKANTLPDADAIATGDELCGYYATHLTRPDLAPGEVIPIDEPRTSVERIRAYLAQVEDTPEGKRALDIINRVAMCPSF